LKTLHPYYHTSKEIDEEVHRLEGSCAAMEVSLEKENGVAITVVRVGSKSSPKPKNRAFLLFGEHSRELISPESGLMLLRQLCGDAPMQEGQDRQEVLAQNEFLLVLNANPRSRLKVEQGDFCIRTNPSGVDLNRNWDEMWTNTAAMGVITDPGPEPFSEPETKILKRLAEDFRPTTFMTIHSGTRGMYMPWAYDMSHLADRNQPAMLEILEKVDAKHCQCPFGAAGKEVGYSCPGTCMDWVYDKLKTPYVFAYEIYTGESPYVGEPDSFKTRFEQQSHLEITEHEQAESLLQLTSGVQAAVDMSEDEDPQHCFTLFNPNSKHLYEDAVTNWAAAYVKTLALVAEDLENSRPINAHNDV